MTGTYHPGSSLLHRCPAGLKLVLLLVFSTALVVVRSPAAVVVAAGVVAGCLLLARIPARLAWQQVRPLRWFVVVLVPFQWWSAGGRAAVVVVGTLVVTVLTASVVTLTTRLSAMLDVIEQALQPLRRLGFDPARASLVLALTIRAVPVLLSSAGQVHDARRARGLERSPRALVVPLVLRTLRHADQLGEALVARGVDD